MPQLLTGLTFGIERTAHLGTTEGTVCQHTAVLTSEGHTLSDTLVDDIIADLSQTIDISLAGTIVTTLYGIVEQTIDRVAIVLITLSGIDTTLCSDRVCTTGRVLDAQVDDIETHLAERGSCRCTSQTGTNNYHIELQLILGVHQALMGFILFPFLRYWTCRNLRI